MTDIWCTVPHEVVRLYFKVLLKYYMAKLIIFLNLIFSFHLFIDSLIEFFCYILRQILAINLLVSLKD